jgi:vancomycin permeability regulator SanA
VAAFAAGGVILILLIAVGSYLLIAPYSRYIITDGSQHTRVGLVLGAGVNSQGKPYKELQSRLDVAVDALRRGQVDVLLVSGDNRIEKYDEPAAMMRYLINDRGVAADKVYRDFAGRSTYESCERAAKVFGLRDVTLISARSHLPRAIYLCRHLGVEAYGIASPVEATNSGRREIVARVKAVLNMYIRGEPTVLGKPIRL